MDKGEMEKRIADCQRQLNDLLAQLAGPLQQLAALQAKIELLRELLQKEEGKP